MNAITREVVTAAAAATTLAREGVSAEIITQDGTWVVGLHLEATRDLSGAGTVFFVRHPDGRVEEVRVV